MLLLEVAGPLALRSCQEWGAASCSGADRGVLPCLERNLLRMHRKASAGGYVSSWSASAKPSGLVGKAHSAQAACACNRVANYFPKAPCAHIVYT